MITKENEQYFQSDTKITLGNALKNLSLAFNVGRGHRSAV